MSASPDLAAHRQLEAGLADALRAADPVAALESLRAHPELDPELRALLRHVSASGFGMSALLVAKLRFERLVQGSGFAAAWFDSDPETFCASFREYHAEVPPRCGFPLGEGRAFRAWCDASGRGVPGG